MDDAPSTGLSDETIEAIKKANPNLELIQLTVSDGTTIVCKMPPRGEYKRFRQMMGDPNQKSVAIETLVRGCLVYPTPPEFDAILNRRPAYAEVFGNKLCEAAGVLEEVVEKKL